MTQQTRIMERENLDEMEDWRKKCPNARNAYHVCTQYCKERIERKERLYGKTAVSADAQAEVHRETVKPCIIDNAIILDEISTGEGETFDWTQLEARPASINALLCLVKDAGQFDFSFWIKYLEDEHIQCRDNVPPRQLESVVNPATAIKVAFKEYCQYCQSRDTSNIKTFEALEENSKKCKPFILWDWNPFAIHHHLLENFCMPAFLQKEVRTYPGQDKQLHKHAICIGPAESATQLHADFMHTILHQTEGKSQFVVYSPDQKDLIYGNENMDCQSFFDPFAPQYVQYPKARQAKPFACILSAGQSIIIPHKHWYACKFLEPTILVTYRFATESNYKPCLQRLCGGTSAFRKRNKVDAPDNVDTDIYVRANMYKDLGNKAFKNRLLSEAIESYSLAIGLLSLDNLDMESAFQDKDIDLERDILATVLCNRAACWVKKEKWVKAIEDCDSVLRLGQSNSLTVKALYRRGKAFEAIGDADNALRDFGQAVELEPNNKIVVEAHENYRSVLHRLIVLNRGTPEIRNRQRKGL